MIQTETRPPGRSQVCAQAQSSTLASAIHLRTAGAGAQRGRDRERGSARPRQGRHGSGTCVCASGEISVHLIQDWCEYRRVSPQPQRLASPVPVAKGISVCRLSIVFDYTLPAARRCHGWGGQGGPSRWWAGPTRPTGGRQLGTATLVTAAGDGLGGGRPLSRLYVGNLAHDTTEADLREVFSPFGEVVSIKVGADRRGRPKGFGYVKMRDEASAATAMESLRGTQVKGRTMDIVRDDPSRRGGGGGRRSGRRRR